MKKSSFTFLTKTRNWLTPTIPITISICFCINPLRFYRFLRYSRITRLHLSASFFITPRKYKGDTCDDNRNDKLVHFTNFHTHHTFCITSFMTTEYHLQNHKNNAKRFYENLHAKKIPSQTGNQVAPLGVL